MTFSKNTYLHCLKRYVENLQSDLELPFLICHTAWFCINANYIALGVLYGNVSIPGAEGQSLIENAIKKLLKSAADPSAKVLWSLRYTQLGRTSTKAGEPPSLTRLSNNAFCFPPGNLDLAFDDSLIDVVKEAWRLVMGDEAKESEFMEFEDREGAYDEE